MKNTFIGGLTIATFCMVALAIAAANAQMKANRARDVSQRSISVAQRAATQIENNSVEMVASYDRSDSQELNRLEEESRRLARTIQASPKIDNPKQTELREKLVETLEKAFTMRQQKNDERVLVLEQRIQGIKSSIESRNKNKQLIIDNRVSELLGKNGTLSWTGPADVVRGMFPNSRYRSNSWEQNSRSNYRTDAYAPLQRRKPGFWNANTEASVRSLETRRRASQLPATIEGRISEPARSSALESETRIRSRSEATRHPLREDLVPRQNSDQQIQELREQIRRLQRALIGQESKSDTGKRPSSPRQPERNLPVNVTPELAPALETPSIPSVPNLPESLPNLAEIGEPDLPDETTLTDQEPIAIDVEN